MRWEGNPYRYSSEPWDKTTHLQYLRARWYVTSMGRFISEDSYEGEITNPLSLNLYTYVSNNSLRYTDPSGHKQCEGAYNCDGDAPTNTYVSMEENFVRYYYFDDRSKMKNASDEEWKYVYTQIYKRSWDQALQYFIAGVITGAALATPAAIFEALEVATMGTTTAAVTSGTAANTIRATVSVGIVKGAGLFESSFLARTGIKVSGLAEVSITGNYITLTDIAIYADSVGAAKTQIGAKEIIQWRNAVIEELKRQGYEKLTITGIRVDNSTSANPRMTIDRTFDLID
ncbi:RHS repeat-associated core domain-containing protein [Marinicrinis sediminis]|uniref:RHS repeat-associated core domain-containing protein n=1 Tax=Marinicrinis sediminis TaxID=1652465 RepID=A0ABW5REE9_9BACL